MRPCVFGTLDDWQNCMQRGLASFQLSLLKDTKPNLIRCQTSPRRAEGRDTGQMHGRETAFPRLA